MKELVRARLAEVETPERPGRTGTILQEVLDLVIVGGCGHVGLPLALAFAESGCRVGIYDIDAGKLAEVRAGRERFAG
jgi:UDP-N-acetyl-D-mannosaminuronic acid dehydrogenase